jgi:hypothetical protein
LRRLHLFEFLDQPWCPQAVRHGATDFLEAITSRGDIYRPIQAEIFRAIDDCGAERVIDLCSGGGGPWLSPAWRSALAAHAPLTVVLTDKFPSDVLPARLKQFRNWGGPKRQAFSWFSPKENHTSRSQSGHSNCESAQGAGLSCVSFSVDAACVPESLRGFRTIFSSFHHFPDTVARAVLGDAVRRSEGFATAEVTSRTLRAFATILLMPLFAWILTPRMRPLRWSRLLLTYLVPVIPLVVLWDGLVSCCRTRTPEELLALTTSFPQYDWQAGYARGQGTWLASVYLIGRSKTCSG